MKVKIPLNSDFATVLFGKRIVGNRSKNMDDFFAIVGHNKIPKSHGPLNIEFRSNFNSENSQKRLKMNESIYLYGDEKTETLFFFGSIWDQIITTRIFSGLDLDDVVRWAGRDTRTLILLKHKEPAAEIYGIKDDSGTVYLVLETIGAEPSKKRESQFRKFMHKLDKYNEAHEGTIHTGAVPRGGTRKVRRRGRRHSRRRRV